MDAKDIALNFALAEFLGFRMIGNGAAWDNEYNRGRVIAGGEAHKIRAQLGIIDTPGNGILFDPIHCESDLKRVEIKLNLHTFSLRDRAELALNFINELQRITKTNENKKKPRKARKKAPKPEGHAPDSVPSV